MLMGGTWWDLGDLWDLGVLGGTWVTEVGLGCLLWDLGDLGGTWVT